MNEDLGTEVEGTLHAAEGAGTVRMVARYPTGVDDLWSALTDPARVACWYATVEGDLTVGGEFTATVPATGWDGRGRIDACEPPRYLAVTMWEPDGPPGVVTAALAAEGDATVLVLERRGVAPDLLWAYGAGWHEHLEDLGSHLAGRPVPDWAARGDARFDELTPRYRAMPVDPGPPG